MYSIDPFTTRWMEQPYHVTFRLWKDTIWLYNWLMFVCLWPLSIGAFIVIRIWPLPGNIPGTIIGWNDLAKVLASIAFMFPIYSTFISFIRLYFTLMKQMDKRLIPQIVKTDVNELSQPLPPDTSSGITYAENGNVKSIARSTYCVYLIGGRDGAIKIGMTRNIESRMAALKTGNGNLKLIFIMPCASKGDCRFLEQSLHTRYAAQRIAGEWFNLSEQDIESIKMAFVKRSGKKPIDQLPLI